MTDLRLPKSRVPVELALPQGLVRAEVFLAEYAPTHAGPERLQDLLEGEEAFFPALVGDEVRIVARHSLRWVRVPSLFYEEPLHGGEPVEIEAEAVLADGTRVRGLARFEAPAGRTRLQDLLNDSRGFVALFEADSVLLVNRQQIVWATQRERA